MSLIFACNSCEKDALDQKPKIDLSIWDAFPDTLYFGETFI